MGPERLADNGAKRRGVGEVRGDRLRRAGGRPAAAAAGGRSRRPYPHHRAPRRAFDGEELQHRATGLAIDLRPDPRLLQPQIQLAQPRHRGAPRECPPDRPGQPPPAAGGRKKSEGDDPSGGHRAHRGRIDPGARGSPLFFGRRRPDHARGEGLHQREAGGLHESH